MTRIIPSLLPILKTHCVPGQYLHLFKAPKAPDLTSTVKTNQKKRKRKMEKLDHLIPKIQTALDSASQEPFLRRLFKGLDIPMIEADSQKLVLHYSLNTKFDLEERERSLNLTKGLLYQYLARLVHARKFPSRLELKRYSFKKEVMDEIYSKIEEELSFKG